MQRLALDLAPSLLAHAQPRADRLVALREVAAQAVPAHHDLALALALDSTDEADGPFLHEVIEGQARPAPWRANASLRPAGAAQQAAPPDPHPGTGGPMLLRPWRTYWAPRVSLTARSLAVLSMHRAREHPGVFPWSTRHRGDARSPRRADSANTSTCFPLSIATRQRARPALGARSAWRLGGQLVDRTPGKPGEIWDGTRRFQRPI
jgi:hypothetical protein